MLESKAKLAKATNPEARPIASAIVVVGWKLRERRCGGEESPDQAGFKYLHGATPRLEQAPITSTLQAPIFDAM